PGRASPAKRPDGDRVPPLAPRARRAHGSVLSSTDRALGALYGLAIGDALGMPAQEFDGDRARAILGTQPDFRDGPPDNPIARGLPAGSVTDDTMQCVLVAELLVDGAGVIAPRALADALMRWEREMARRGRSELLGPSTRHAHRARGRRGRGGGRLRGCRRRRLQRSHSSCDRGREPLRFWGAI